MLHFSSGPAHISPFKHKNQIIQTDSYLLIKHFGDAHPASFELT